MEVLCKFQRFERCGLRNCANVKQDPLSDAWSGCLEWIDSLDSVKFPAEFKASSISMSPSFQLSS